MLLSPLATAIEPAPRAHVATYMAPYSGIPTSSAIGGVTGCGASAAILVFPFFNMTTGLAIDQEKVAAHSCGSANNSALAYATAGFSSNPFTTTAGTHSLKENWTVNFTVNLAATAGSVTQIATASFSVVWLFQLTDLTNSTVFLQSTFPSLSKLITTGTFNHIYAKIPPRTVLLSGKLVAGHMYAFMTAILVFVNVFVSPGSSHASANVNMGAAGRHSSLDFVSFT